MESPLSKLLDDFAMQLEKESDNHRDEKRVYEELKCIVLKATHLSGFVKGMSVNANRSKK